MDRGLRLLSAAMVISTELNGIICAESVLIVQNALPIFAILFYFSVYCCKVKRLEKHCIRNTGDPHCRGA